MRRVTSIVSASLKAAGARRSELSSTSPTSAMLRDGRRPVPAKITSSMPEPRMFLYELSPITQRRASTRFDLPQPFGPTTPVRPGSILNSVGSQKLLKPARRSRSNFMAPRPFGRRSQRNFAGARPASVDSVPYDRHREARCGVSRHKEPRDQAPRPEKPVRNRAYFNSGARTSSRSADRRARRPFLAVDEKRRRRIDVERSRRANRALLDPIEELLIFHAGVEIRLRHARLAARTRSGSIGFSTNAQVFCCANNRSIDGVALVRAGATRRA